jgi:hypothetical protein
VPLPTAFELHVARELAINGGPLVAIGGVVGGFLGAVNSEGEGRGVAMQRGVLGGCALVFVVLIVLATS